MHALGIQLSPIHGCFAAWKCLAIYVRKQVGRKWFEHQLVDGLKMSQVFFFNHTWDDSLRFLVFLGWVKYQGHVGSSRSVNQPLVIVALTGDTWRRFSSSLLAWLQNLLACAAILIHLFWRIIAPIYRLTFFPI